MKAIALNGSPRKGGNTEIMLKAALAPLEAAGFETELIQVGGRVVRGCIACGKCAEMKNGRCAIDSDGFNEWFAQMCQADAILIGSPTYFADVTAETKALLDRAGYVALRNDGLLARKIGAAVTVHRRGGSIHTFDTINHMFQINRMIIPGSTYWNFGVGRGVGEVSEDEEALRNMKDLGETIAWLCQKLRA